MHQISIDLCENIMEQNMELARKNAERLKQHSIRSYDLFGPVGSGKTKLIETMSDILKGENIRCGVIAGDVAGDADYQRFRSRGLPVINLNTGKECHLDAHLAQHALEKMELDDIDVLFIENVGNIICPADFPLGTDRRILVLSVTEGDDMVKKHPMVFHCVDVVVVNKVDLAEIMEVDPKSIVQDVKEVNPSAVSVMTDAKKESGVRELMKVIGLL